jgi:hypothetical protein
MSKYDYLKDKALELINKGLNSAEVAKELMGGNESFSRCIRRWVEVGENKKVLKGVKIVLFDIETAPIKTYTWSKWQTPISDNQIIDDWFILSWSAKELFDNKTYHMVLTPEEVKDGDDKRITEGLWKVFDEADILIAHNLKKFDKKKANTRFLKHNLYLPSSYKDIDTLIEARKNFAITSNRLDYLAQFFGIEGKQDTPKGLWNDCMEGDEEALTMMWKYCNQDVKVLEDVYLRLRPYMTSHPNINLFIGSTEPKCKACGSSDLKQINDYYTTVQIYEGFRCGHCGSVHRGRKNVTDKGIRDSLLR